MIVERARELFSRRGVDGVSIAEVALAAGVSKANVMHHFGSKDGLYAAVLEVIDEHLDAAVDAAEAAVDPAAALPDALVDWASAHPDDVRVMAYGLLRLPERSGRWALSGPVERMMALVGGDPDTAATRVIDLLGTVTYREMARPLVEAHSDATTSRRRRRTVQGALR
jgi:AcrR family transcriptional regulator